jgi:hypothetical protein
MTFRVKYHPVQPKPDATITLELYSTELAAYGGNPIPHYRQNGRVILYALPAPVQKHDIAVLSVNPLKTIVGQGYPMNINVTVANQGDFTETFNVTLYINTTAVETKQVTLTSLNSTTLTFTWNATGFAKGNYTLWAYAWPVPGETDIDDNTFMDGIVTVTIPGDVDGDFEVRLVDLVHVAIAYGSTPNQQNWNPNTDIDNNGQVGLRDLVIVAIHYGQKDP